MKRRISTWTLLGNWKKLWNMEVTIILIEIGTFGTITKGLLKGLEDLEVGGRVEKSKLQRYWERPEYWEELWRLEETCCHLNSSERPSAKTNVKNSQGVNNKLWNMKVTIMIVGIDTFGTVTKGTGGLGSRRTSGDYPNHSVINNSQNTEKSRGVLRRLPVAQTPMKNHQLKLMW